MSLYVHQLLLVLSALALWDAALRLAARTGARGLERVVAAAPIAAAAAVLEALALGRLDLGGESLALAGAAGLTWIAARALLRAPEHALRADIAAWWRSASNAQVAATAAVAGLWAAWVVAIVRHPVIGIDGVTYQLTSALAWVHEGNTGSVVDSFYDLPTGAYPVTNEVLLSWAVGLSDAFAVGVLLAPLLAALLAAAGWLGLRGAGVPPAIAALAIAAVLTFPFFVTSFGQPGSDIPASAWLACAAALTAGTSRRPGLLAPAVVAAALSLGSKTTTLPLALLVVAAGLYLRRSDLRSLSRPLALAAGAGALAGLTWYARNLIDHGSPLWPFVSGPWGDAQPILIELVDHSLLERPRATLEGRTAGYFDAVGGGAILIGAALVLAPLLDRRRTVVLVAGATAIALFSWLNAPVTGVGDIAELSHLSLSSVRYLLPVVVAAALTLALASGQPRAQRAVAGAFAAVIALNLIADWPLGYPRGPSFRLGLAVVVAAILLALAARGAARLLERRPVAAAALAVAGLLAAAGLSASASGFVGRHARLHSTAYSPIAEFLGSRSDYRSGEEPVAVNQSRPAIFAGERLRHEVELIPAGESCAAVAARRRRGWVVLQDASRFHILDRPDVDLPTPGPARCLTRLPPAARLGPFRVYAPVRH